MFQKGDRVKCKLDVEQSLGVIIEEPKEDYPYNLVCLIHEDGKYVINNFGKTIRYLSKNDNIFKVE
jgi:hypothetical protein